MSAGARRDLLDALKGATAFELDGRTFTVPQRSVLEWMDAIAGGEFDAVVPGLLAEEDARYLYDRLLDEDNPLALSVVESIGLWVTEAVANRPWWEVHRALLWSLDAWRVFEPWCVAEGVGDPLRLPLRTFCGIYVRFVMIALGEEAEPWYDDFTRPPLGSAETMDSRPEWAEEEVESDFSSAFGQWATLAGNTVPE